MPEIEIHNLLRRDMEKLDQKLDSVVTTIGKLNENQEGTRKAVEFQNGRVRKLEDRWERLMWGAIVSMGSIVISLVVYIYITNAKAQSLAIQQALQGMEVQVVQ